MQGDIRQQGSPLASMLRRGDYSVSLWDIHRQPINGNDTGQSSGTDNTRSLKRGYHLRAIRLHKEGGTLNSKESGKNLDILEN